MNDSDILGTIGRSAREELCFVCDRAAQDSYSVYRFFTSREAMQTYRFLWLLCVTAVEITIILGRIARIYWDEYAQPRIDAHVNWALTENQDEPRLSCHKSSTMPAIAIPTTATSSNTSIKGCDADQDVAKTAAQLAPAVQEASDPRCTYRRAMVPS